MEVNGQLVIGGHPGVDFACPVGTPVVVADGSLVHAGDDPAMPGRGIYVEIDTGTHWVYYMHLSEVQPVLTGSSGFVTGPHLHLGVQRKSDGVWIKPLWE